MGFISCYKEGMRLFQEKEYAKAIECFAKGLNVGNDSDCALMLGKCFEHGLGVEKDLVIAKDCYKSALIKFGFMHSPDCEEILWLKSKIGEMSDIPDINELSRYIEPVGWVKVKRTKINEWSVRFNEDGTLINISQSRPLIEGINIAKSHNAQENKNWTCDGYTRFYDGYTLNADLFRLSVKRGNSKDFQSIINGRDCMIIFPYDADLNYLYIQETIMNKTRELLRKRAEYVFPMKLKEVSERIGVPYGRCKISPTLSKSYAYFTIKTRDVTFALGCIDLPEESIEAICVHELMHTFSADHNSRFYTKLKEYGGQRLYDRDFRLEDGITWRRLRLIKG